MKKLVAATCVCVAAGIAAPMASAAPAQSSKLIHIKPTLKPHKHVKPGVTMTLTAKHVAKKTEYNCIQVILHRKVAGSGTANLTSIVQATSNKKGVVTCKEKFKPFSGIDAGKTVNCPTTKKQAKKHYSCAVAIYDSATDGKKGTGFVRFKAKG